MKKIILILFIAFIYADIAAQSPEKMNYQSVLRNNSGQLITSTTVGMKISILQGSATGTLVYSETLSPATNANGLISIEFGGGLGFDTITWANGPFFIKTETDPLGGNIYTISGTSQLLSAPYALYTNNANMVDGLNTGNTSGNIPVSNGTVNTNLNADMVDGYNPGNANGNLPISNGTVNTSLNADLLDGYNSGNANGNIPISNGTVNTNLNADLLDGLNTGNASGNIPVSNGTVNTNLNADMLEGLNTGNASGNIPVSNGIVNTNLNADMFDGHNSGNSSGNIPVSNGTVNTNLNSDMVDGYHSGSFIRIAASGTVSANNYTDISIPHYYPFTLHISSGWAGSYSQYCGGQVIIQGFENDGHVGLLITYSNGADYTGAPGTGTVTTTYKSCSMSSSITLLTFGGSNGNMYTLSTTGTNLILRLSSASGSVEAYYKLMY